MTTRVERLIGKSYQNRNIYLYEFFVEKPRFNVLICGTVHGIEAEGGQAVERLMDDIEEYPDFYYDVNIAVLPYWNPDGVANQTYGNAQNYQIGYSILNAVTPEIRVIWEYLRDNQYYPDFYIDNHNLDRWQRGAGTYLYDHVPRLALHDDLVIGMNISPFFRHKIGWNQWTDLVSHVTTKGHIETPDLIWSKFWQIYDDSSIKYNTSYDIGHFDSFLAARFDTLCFLIEGVVPADQTPTNPLWEQTKQAQFLANKYMIDWVRTKAPHLVESKCVPPYVGERLPINVDYNQYELFPHRITVENDSTGTATNIWTAATRFQDKPILDSHWTTAPMAYAIHNTNEEDLNVYMKWWGFEWTQGLAGDSYDTEQFHCTTAGAWDDEDGNITAQWTQPNVTGYNVSATRTNFSQYTIYSTNQFGGDLLLYLLEPLAEGNISRHQTLFPTLRLRVNDDFPILRLIRKR